MENLITDCVGCICKFLDNHESMQLLSTSTQMDLVKFKIWINTMIDNSKIKHLRYYDSFTNVRADKTFIFPKNVTHITFANELGVFELHPDKKIIPTTVTTLTINTVGYLNNLIISSSVTHLNFGDSYDYYLEFVGSFDEFPTNSDVVSDHINEFTEYDVAIPHIYLKK